MDLKWYIIYRISNVFDEDIYIGCTFNTIAHRFNQHVAMSNHLDTKLARKIRDIGKENLSITDLYSRFMSLNDARNVERGLIKLLEPTLNTKSTGGYRDSDGNWDETEYKKDYGREYRSRIKDKLTERTDCECGGSFTYPNKARHLKTQRHLSSVSVFSASPSIPPPLVNPGDDPECHSE